MTIPDVTLIFDDPRFRMTIGGRLLVRIVTYICYVLLIAAMGTFFISGITHLAIFGILILFFLLNWWTRRTRGEVPISAFPRAGTLNVASAFGSATFAVLERAFDRSLITRENFYLEATKHLMEDPRHVRGSAPS